MISANNQLLEFKIYHFFKSLFVPVSYLTNRKYGF